MHTAKHFCLCYTNISMFPFVVLPQAIAGPETWKSACMVPCNVFSQTISAPKIQSSIFVFLASVTSQSIS